MSPVLPQPPALHGRDVTVAGRTWQLRWSADLSATVESSPAFERALAAALVLPDGRTPGPWRAVIDVAGTLCALAVDPEAQQLTVGSPRFQAEQTLLFLLDAVHVPETELAPLRAHVQAWHDASAERAPLLVDVAAANAGLDRLLARHEAHWPQVLGRMRQTAARVHSALASYQPSLEERLSLWGLDLCTRSAVLRIHVLRLVAALPALDHDEAGTEVVRLLRETLQWMADDSAQLRVQADLPDDATPLPLWAEWTCRLLRNLAGLVPALWLATATRRGVRLLARHFIAGETVAEAQPTLQALHQSGRSATLDQLGELVVCRAEAETYTVRVLELIDGVSQAFPGEKRNAAGLPLAHVSVKTSALCSDFNPDDPDGTWARVGPRLTRVLVHAQAKGACIQLDAEHRTVRDLNLEMLDRALTQTPALAAWADVGIVVQAYVRDAAEHLQAVVALARRRGVVMPVRLVKGAYWDAETTEAAAHDTLPPQWLNKAETDAMFQLLTLAALDAHDAVHLCLASHNLRDHAFAEEARAVLYPKARPVEHQVLHQSYEALSHAMTRQGWSVRHYVPVGSLLVGMAYLVRRILENSSQVGVLTLARHGADLPTLLRLPGEELAAGPIVRDAHLAADALGTLPPFRNVAPAELHLPGHRAALDAALAGGPVVLGTLSTTAEDRHGPRESVASPSHPDRVLAEIRHAVQADVRPAVTRALRSSWLTTPAPTRSALLIRAAEHLRASRMDVAALVAHEAGKARAEALGDVDEAIDFLQFYAREALTLRPDQEPLGVVAVVAPWNFPLAIPTGMVAGALAAGNAVILKSAEQTPLCAELLVSWLHHAGVPTDAVQHLPGDGFSVGGPLVAHPLVTGAVFTGSLAVGTQVWRKMLRKGHGRTFHRVITEMGGKNAILVTATADLDEAIAASLRACFGHAGQKCSAASRILVDARVMPVFAQRFAQAAAEWTVGLAEAPGTRVNPVVSLDEQARLRDNAAEVCAEATALGGQVLVDRSLENVGDGWTVGPVVVQLPSLHVPQESLVHRELFGPIVHLLPFERLSLALDFVNASPYALTAGVFAQSQNTVARVTRAIRAGNVYVNRSVTGARVAIEPFGGFHLSGTGPKAGGTGYLSALTYRQAVGAALDPQAAWVLDPLQLPRKLAPVRASTPPTDLHQLAAQLRHTGTPTRAIPGQSTHNDWTLPRGPTLVLAGRAEPLPRTLLHVSAAHAMDNPLHILTLSDAAHAVWQAHPVANAPGVVVERVRDRGALDSALHDPGWATVVLDGDAMAFGPLVDTLCQVPEGGRDLRQLIVGAETPESPLEALQAHAHCRTVAVHTMRHGAALVLPTSPSPSHV